MRKKLEFAINQEKARELFEKVSLIGHVKPCLVMNLLTMCDRVCKILHMATNLSIDPKLLDRALKSVVKKPRKRP